MRTGTERSDNDTRELNVESGHRQEGEGLSGSHGEDVRGKERRRTGEETADEEEDLNLYVQNLLDKMQGRFQEMSESIVSRVDEMGDRIDGLEKLVGELINQVGEEEKQ